MIAVTSRLVKLWLAALLLVLGLQFYTAPAHAQLAVVDPANIAQTTIAAANAVITNVNLVLQQIQNALKSIIEAAMKRLQMEQSKRLAQAHLDQSVINERNSKLAEEQNKSAIPPSSQACGIARSGGAKDALAAAEGSAGGVHQRLAGERGIGGGADAEGSSASARMVHILNRAGLLGDTGRYGTPGSSAISQMQDHRTLSGDDAVYVDGDMRISSVLNPIHTPAAKVDAGAFEYTLPKTAGVSKEGYVTFSDSATGPINATGDELAYITAFAFCDHLVPDLPTPTHGNHLTVDDIVNIHEDRVNTATRGAAADRCFAALRYRTACPSSSDDSFKSADGTSCHKVQVAMCNFMKKPAKDGGLGLSSTRPSLANCDTNGLSEAEYDRLLATRCHDESYVQSIYAALEAQSAEHFMLYECPMLEMTYEMKMDHERTALEQAINGLISMRGMGSRPDVTSRPVGQ